MNTEPVRKSKWGKVGKATLIFGSVLLCVAGIAYSLTDLSSAASSYERNRDAAKSTGLCLTGSDAEKLFKVPDSENGAIALKGFSNANPPLHNYSTYQIDNFSKEELLNAWKSAESHIPTIRAALAKPRLIFQRSFKQPYVYNKDFQSLVSIDRLILRRADLAAKNNEIELAGDLLTLGANLAIRLGDEPTLTALEVRASLAMRTESVLKHLIKSHGNDSRWLNVIERTLAILDDPYDVRSVLQFQHWDWLWVGRILLADYSEGTLEDLGYKREDGIPNLTLASRLIPRFRVANLSRFHQYYVAAVRGLPKDPNDFVGIRKGIMDAQSGIEISDRSVSYAYLRFSFSSHSPDVGSYEVIEPVEVETARRNVLIQALTIVKRKWDPHRGIPLNGRFALDIGGRPIGLDHNKDGWVVYSVGKNLTYEHLVPPPANVDDFIVRLPK